MSPFFTAAFLLLAFLAAYILIGYPLLLAWLAARFGKPIRKGAPEDPARKTVSILIAVYNGAAVLRPKLESVMALDYPKELLEVLVLSDGSTDGTNEIVRGFAGQGIELVELPHAGKPAALSAGIARSKGEILVLTDARQTLEPDSVRQLVACFSDPTVGAVSGDLPMRPGAGDEHSSTSLYWRIERWIRINLGRVDSTFGTTGPFYAMRRELAPEDASRYSARRYVSAAAWILSGVPHRRG